MARQAADIISTFIGCDIQDVWDMIYQPTLTNPRIYSWNDRPRSYLCCPTAKQKCPKGYDWQRVGTAYNAPDRPVYAVVNAE